MNSGRGWPYDHQSVCYSIFTIILIKIRVPSWILSQMLITISLSRSPHWRILWHHVIHNKVLYHLVNPSGKKTVVDLIIRNLFTIIKPWLVNMIWEWSWELMREQNQRKENQWTSTTVNKSTNTIGFSLKDACFINSQLDHDLVQYIIKPFNAFLSLLQDRIDIWLSIRSTHRPLIPKTLTCPFPLA